MIMDYCRFCDTHLQQGDYKEDSVLAMVGRLCFVQAIICNLCGAVIHC